MSHQLPPRTTASRLRSIISGSVGNLVEWYDWYVYSAFALYFAPAFFPKGNLTVQLLNSAAIFAVGFLMRPLGGWLMGVYADRAGRKAALLGSVLLMCGGSLLIALTPSYEQIGVAAPVLLVLARLLQGLSVGGEYGTSATYLSRNGHAAGAGASISSFPVHDPDCRRSCWPCWHSAGVAKGAAHARSAAATTGAGASRS